MKTDPLIVDSVTRALKEDIGDGDISAALIDADKQVTAEIITREAGVFCGEAWANETYKQLDPNIEIDWHAHDGDVVQALQVLAVVKGKARAIITGERTVLNWLQTLSGTASVVAEYVAELEGMHTTLLDTRKTIPGMRYAQKYAVSCGGARNHRMGLYDAFLIKENHIISCGSIRAAIRSARAMHPEKTLEIEVENLNELKEALAEKPDIIMLDNFSDEDRLTAVRLNHGLVKLEVSGNVDQDSIARIAQSGVDFVSVGALTKHVRALDLSMRFVG